MMGLLEMQERAELIPNVAFFTEGRPDKLTTVIHRNHVIRIPTDTIPEQYAYQVVRYCELSAWVEDPALILKLLKQWEHVVILNKAINRLKSAVPPKYYQGGRVWDTCLLAVLDLPFLGREITRQAVEYFSYPLVPTLHPAGVRVLVVKGPTQSGKSFTYDYIRYVNSVFTTLNFNMVWIDFKKQVTTRYGPIELMESLLTQVNPNWRNESVILPVLDAQQPARWMQEFAALLVDQLNSMNLRNNSTSNWFILLDGFDDQKVPRETLDLIQVLAAVAVGSDLSAESNDLIRLVIMGFPENISNYRNRVKVDDISPLKRSDVELYFKRYAAFRSKTLDAPALDALVNKVQMNAIKQNEFRTKQIAAKALQIAIAIL